MPNDDSKIRGAHVAYIAKFLGKNELLAAGAVSTFFRECSEGELSKRFCLDFLKYVRDGQVEKIKALVSRYPGLILYRFKPEDNPDCTHEEIDAFKNRNAFEVALCQLDAEVRERVAALFSETCDNELKKVIKEKLEENLGKELLYHVIRGNQQAVVEILTRYPKLLLYRGNVVDYSGREFKHVTALELATWALDVRHMAPVMLKCVTENEDGKNYSEELAQELQQQYDNVTKEGGGVTYTIGCGLLKMSEDPRTLLPGKTDEERYAELNRKLNRHNGLIQYEDKLFYFHNLTYPKKLSEITSPDAVKALKGLMNKEGRTLEVNTLQIINDDDELKMIQENVPDSRHIFREKHYDFTPLRDALGVYVNGFRVGAGINYNTMWGLREAHWCSVVGLAQHYAPAHVAQHYCNPDESFNPNRNYTPPEFKEEVLRRVLEFKNKISGKKERWWGDGTSAFPDRSLGTRLGLYFSIYRADGRGAWSDMESMCFWSGGTFPYVDLFAVTALCKMRTDDALVLKQLLDSLHKPGAGSEPARCVV